MPAPKRLAVLRCLDWSAVVAAKNSTTPCAVIHAQRVISRTPAAMRYGVQVGMRRRHAQALCPDIEIVAHQPSRDRTAFDAVVRVVNELVPLIEVSEPGLIVFAARGPSRYMGGDGPMALKIVEALKTSVADSHLAASLVGVAVGVGIADSRLAAQIAAHASAFASSSANLFSPYVVEPDKTNEWLAPQSVRVLSEFASINRETISLLERLGLNTLRDVCALSESILAGRFGELGVELHRLSRGDEQYPLAVVPHPPEHLCIEKFDEPVSDQQIIINSVQRMAVAFTEYYSVHGSVCVRIVISFESEAGKRSERLWYRPHGLTTSAIIENAKWQLEAWLASQISSQISSDISGYPENHALENHALENRSLENRSLENHGLVRVQLIADEVRTDTARQLRLWGGSTQTDETATQAIGRLSELLGSSAVQVAKWQGGRDILDSYQLVSATHAQTIGNANSHEQIPAQKWRGALPNPSPSVVYSEPIQVQINDQFGKLLSVSARHELSASPVSVIIGSTHYKVNSWAGPWPVEERWWDLARSRRLVRLQLVCEKITVDSVSQILAMLAILEHGEWTVAAIYS
ncbi:MAG: DNA polymerase Y family protein [Actinomycetota bacterium]